MKSDLGCALSKGFQIPRTARRPVPFVPSGKTNIPTSNDPSARPQTKRKCKSEPAIQSASEPSSQPSRQPALQPAIWQPSPPARSPPPSHVHSHPPARLRRPLYASGTFWGPWCRTGAGSVLVPSLVPKVPLPRAPMTTQGSPRQGPPRTPVGPSLVLVWYQIGFIQVPIQLPPQVSIQVPILVSFMFSFWFPFRFPF